MTAKRIQLLNEIHFVWSAREATWQERFRELQEFVHVNGFGSVPSKKTALLDWLRYQQKLYREHKKGKEVSLTETRIAQLKRLGFLVDSK